jgi:hypothetical protein
MRYSGTIGVASQTEISPGVWEETITEQDYIGEVVQRTEVLEEGDSIHSTQQTSTSISVLSRVVGFVNDSDLRYVTFSGMRWNISSVVNQPPRLVLYIREEYHGPASNGAA